MEVFKDFPKQFEFNPVIKNGHNIKPAHGFIVVGMGGSNLSADLIKVRDPLAKIIVHRDYGLPDVSDEVLRSSLIILSSYSGNTEEVLVAFDECLAGKLNFAVISSGGKLMALAEKNNTPFIKMPATAIQPRHALGFNLISLVSLIGDTDAAKELARLPESLNVEDAVKKGRDFANILKNKIPVIYSSKKNNGVAYNWKIKFNETSKIPAFTNVFPELNHNEMIGFGGSIKDLTEKFHFIFLRDMNDDKKILKRMYVTEKMYEKRELGVDVVHMGEGSSFHKIFSSLMIVDWASFYLAEYYGHDPANVPMVEEFKRLII